VRSALKNVLGELPSVGIEGATDLANTVQNIVSSAILNQPDKLNRCPVPSNHIKYESEQLQGLVYHFNELAVVGLPFSGGNLVMSGWKHLKDAELTLTVIENRLTNLRLQD
jgi:TATA-box binding protein (TBP) (component of TFIID and TFIIIB)